MTDPTERENAKCGGSTFVTAWWYRMREGIHAFISKARLKLAKNQANAKQHPEA